MPKVYDHKLAFRELPVSGGHGVEFGDRRQSDDPRQCGTVRLRTQSEPILQESGPGVRHSHGTAKSVVADLHAAGATGRRSPKRACCANKVDADGMEVSIDLDALDDYLMSDHAPDDSMGLSDLDGFLTGIVVGPELILPSEWLPVIWGGEEPVFHTEGEMRTILGTIMGRYNEIVACLIKNPDGIDPIFLEGPEGEVTASDWTGGFLDAVALRPMAWKPLVESDGAGILMAPLFLLNGDMGIDDAADENELLAQASDMIPTCIAGIHEFWRNDRKPPSAGVVAGQEEAVDAGDTTVDFDCQNDGSGRQSHRESRRRRLRK
jgi:uncharacterized protein